MHGVSTKGPLTLSNVIVPGRPVVIGRRAQFDLLEKESLSRSLRRAVFYRIRLIVWLFHQT